MRPSLLDPLFAPVTTLPGIGPKQEERYGRLLGRGSEWARVLDLLFHLPASVIDRTKRPKLRDIVPGEVVTVAVKVDLHQPPPRHRPRAPYRIYASDETADLILTYFNAPKGYLEKLFPVGARRYVSGTTALFDGMRQMVHPERVVDEADFETLPLIEPVYPLTEGLTLRQLGRMIDAAAKKLPELPEWQEPHWLAQQHWPPFREALATLHRPPDLETAKPESAAWSRLAYDELLAGQLALALVRAHVRRPAGRPTVGDGRLREKIVAALPFALTGSQREAVDDILADMAQPQRMLRLLQGDVGSGKTVVALLAAAAAIEAGRQAALMAPTELLARQHHATLVRLGEPAGVRIALVTGRERGRERDAVLERLARGEIDLVVGTHALFQEA
ncbi:MAG TPA: DEAD/DEAH box helicase, partial [Xanthobacteraceae bacterium]